MKDIQQTNVEQLMSQVLRQRVTRGLIKLNLPPVTVYETLLACYQAEVCLRHRDFIPSEELDSQLSQIVSWLTNPQAKPWMVLCGKCGNGKSTMVKALRQLFSFYPQKDPRDNQQMGLVIKSAKDISLACREEGKDFMSFISKPMLAIDDLGIEPGEILVYGNTITPLVDALTYRYEEQLFTVITTNLTPAQIRKQYGERIADRLNEMTERIVFKNDSYQLVGLSSNPPLLDGATAVEKT